MIHERRQYQRLVPDSPVQIHFGEIGTALLFDVSEGGIGIGRALSALERRAFPLDFGLPGGGRFRASAETAWASDSNSRAGFRFLDMTEPARAQLRDWIAARAYDTAQAPFAVPGDEVASLLRRSFGEHEAALTHLREASASSLQARPESMWRAVGLCLAIVALVAACLYFGHLVDGIGHNVQAKGITPLAKTGAPLSNTSGGMKPPATQEVNLPAALPLDRPGFVIQVGAMTHENHADAMRNSLQQKNFPAFVFRRSTGLFYHVAVGPYDDAATAAKIGDKLRTLGFETVLQRWSPE
jgi:SPOR domain/PilZ domain